MRPLPLAVSLASLCLALPAAALPGRLVLELPETPPSLLDGDAPAARLIPELHERIARQVRDLALYLGHDELPFALDDGGGAASEERVIAFILGFFPGFGLGHLIIDDEDGFLFYLLVDFVVVAAFVVVDVLFPTIWAITVLGWIGLHVLQGIDAYRSAGGGRRRGDLWPPPTDDRALAFAPGLDGGRMAAGPPLFEVRF
jgi:hypothetical protein